ncbi:MAG: hypothetical protein MZV65_52615 [Chromatiales bacterium]|nr:hypothetical protein [Chromatiales bacterium]
MRQGLDVPVHPHMLRHSFASRTCWNRAATCARCRSCSATPTSSTTQVYTHLDFQHLAKVYDAAHLRARRKKARRTGFALARVA